MKRSRKGSPVLLLIGPVAPPMGGMTVSLDNIIRSMKDKYDVHVLDITGYRARRQNALFVTGFIYQILLVLKLLGILVSKNPDIIHIQMASYTYFYRRSIDIIICKIFGKKIVTHLRGAQFIEFYEGSNALGRLFIRFILRISDRIIALSGVWRDFLATISDPLKIRVIPNGVRCEDFRPTKYEKPDGTQLGEGISVIFTGSIGKRKGVFDILNAIPDISKKCRDIVFMFCGPEEFSGELKEFNRIIEENKIEKYVKYLGVVEGRDKIGRYLSSDIFILPSYAENLSNSILEAMAAGLSVVVSDVGAASEIVKDGVNGFIIKPGDIASIISKVLMLAQSRDLRRSMGEQNAILAADKYDMPVIIRKIEDVYKELL